MAENKLCQVEFRAFDCKELAKFKNQLAQSDGASVWKPLRQRAIPSPGFPI